MKKQHLTLLVLSAFVLKSRATIISDPSPAPLYRHELSGGLTFNSYIRHGYFNNTCETLEQQGYTYQGECFDIITIPVGADLRYFYHPSQHWAIGGLYGTSLYHERMSYDEENENGQPTYVETADSPSYHIHVRSRYLLLGAKLHWLAKPGFHCYSLAAGGIEWQHHATSAQWMEDEDGNYPLILDTKYLHNKKEHHRQTRLAYQITPIGISMGTGNLHFFMELGYGVEGVFNIGLSYHFHRVSSK